MTGLLRPVLAALLMASCLGACTRVTESDPEPDGIPTPARTIDPIVAGVEVPRPPAGTRWQGVHGVVVAVPRDWSTSTDPCPSGTDSVWMTGDHRLAEPCPTIPARGSVLRIEPSGGGGLRHRSEVGDLDVRHSGVSCRASASGPCTLAFAVPSRDASFQATYVGPAPEAFVRRMMRSLTSLQPGLTTVPTIAYGEAVGVAKERLGEAGLVGVSPEVDFPHYATGTLPAAGRVVPAGSTVRLTIGDG